MPVAKARDRVGQHARQHAVLGRDELLFLVADDLLFDVADVLAQALDLLLRFDDRRIGDDGERGIEKRTDLVLAVLARFRPQRRDDELVLGRQLLGFGAVFGGVLQDGVDGLHQAAGLFVGRLALARVLLDRGSGGSGSGVGRASRVGSGSGL